MRRWGRKKREESKNTKPQQPKKKKRKKTGGLETARIRRRRKKRGGTGGVGHDGRRTLDRAFILGKGNGGKKRELKLSSADFVRLTCAVCRWGGEKGGLTSFQRSVWRCWMKSAQVCCVLAITATEEDISAVGRAFRLCCGHKGRGGLKRKKKKKNRV